MKYLINHGREQVFYKNCARKNKKETITRVNKKLSKTVVYCTGCNPFTDEAKMFLIHCGRETKF